LPTHDECVPSAFAALRTAYAAIALINGLTPRMLIARFML
jgi:hypothetical protein